MDLTLLGICGSLRKDSYNRMLLRDVAQLLPAGVTLDVLDLHRIPPFDQDEERTPPDSVVEMKTRVRAADAVLFATPEYNYSLSGVLKNAIDWGSRPQGDSAWAGKPAAVCGASVGAFGTARAQLHLRQVALALDLRMMAQPEILVASAADRFDADGHLSHAATRTMLEKFVSSFIAWTRGLRAAQ